MDFSNLKVLVIGDICLDVVINGQSTRLSPEAPVPVILNPTKNYSLGMLGNVTSNLSNLGAEVFIQTMIASDDEGNIIEELLEEHSIIFETGDVINELPYTTNCKTRVMANGHQVCRVDTENITEDKEFLDAMVENLNMHDDNTFDMIIVSDYNKGFITDYSWKKFLPILQRINKGEIFIDTKKNYVRDFKGCILFPNTKELDKMTDNSDINSAFKLIEEIEAPFLIETASEEGAYAYIDNKIIQSSAIHSEVFDVCGAGDTFIAAFSLYYTETKNIQRSLDFANYCCSKVVMKKGTIPITYMEALQFDYKI